MQFTPTAIPEVRVLTPPRFTDSRGFFAETYRAEWFPGLDFVQDNHSYSRESGTIRGLHYQLPPGDQAKLVRVVQGRINDIAVDLRMGSPTYLRHVVVELTAERGEQLLVPSGFAHGFVTLESDTVVLYKVSSYYSSKDEVGIAWDDPTLGVDWGVASDPVLSARDRTLPRVDPEQPPFRFGGDK